MSGLQGLGEGLGAIGGVVSAGAQYSAGNQANAIGKIQQGQAENNAALLDYSATTAQGAGINAASNDLRKNKFDVSHILALNAADGGSSTDKNVAELLANTSGMGEYNALNDIYEGSSQAPQLRNQAVGERNEGDIARYQGKQAQNASRIAAISSLIGGGSKAASFAGKYGNSQSNFIE